MAHDMRTCVADPGIDRDFTVMDGPGRPKADTSGNRMPIREPLPFPKDAENSHIPGCGSNL